MKKVVWYIHGANSSPASFAYIKTKMPAHDHVDISYDRDIERVISDLVQRSKFEARQIVIVGHSLGGVIAVAAAQRGALFHKIITLASPFGGCEMASIMRWFSFDSLYAEIHPHSELIKRIRPFETPIPIWSFVTRGMTSPPFGEESDGVVTVRSQTSLITPRYEFVRLNHFEILLSEPVAEKISYIIHLD